MQVEHERNDGVGDCDHGQSPRDDRTVLSRNNPCVIGEAADDDGQRRTADDRPRGRADTILICILTGLSGAITGFVFAGQFAVAGVAYAALILGGVLGWLARGAVA